MDEISCDIEGSVNEDAIGIHDISAGNPYFTLYLYIIQAPKDHDYSYDIDCR